MFIIDHINYDLQKYFNIDNTFEKRNVTGYNKTYTELYNNNTIQIVADWYKKDIEFWGFDFDTGPTKNYWNV